MNRTKKLIRNVIVLAALIYLLFVCSNLYLSPLSAHKHSEKGIHYGPSEIVHTENFEKGKYFLCTYDKWVSCNTVKRVLFFFWTFGSQVTGFENDTSKKLAYGWNMSDGDWKTYGIINDKAITEVEILLEDGKTLYQTEFYDHLFLFTWKDHDGYLKKISGYDKNGGLIYEDIPGGG